jgi:hypothetical protein
MRVANRLVAISLCLLVVGLVTASPRAAAAGKGGQSPFTGTYSGDMPGAAFGGWAITIRPSGKISGTSHTEGIIFTDGSVTGKVDGAGRMTVSGTQTWAFWTSRGISQIQFTADVTKNEQGDLLGTTTTGQTFTWVRQ